MKSECNNMHGERIKIITVSFSSVIRLELPLPFLALIELKASKYFLCVPAKTPAVLFDIY